jgi:hypothetical protein
MNRWAAGENPFSDADWTQAWRVAKVSDREWKELRSRLREEVERWATALEAPREVKGVELTGMIASIAHLAYHLGAMRQIHKDARGPRADD